MFDFSDADCQSGCISRFFGDLYDYFRSDRRAESASFDFRSHVSRMLDSLFATVYFRYGVGTDPRRHYQQHDRFIGCVAATRRQLSPVPFDRLERELSVELEKSFNITRLLLDAFDLATEVANWTTSGLITDEGLAPSSSPEPSSSSSSDSLVELLHGHQCSRALTRLRHCAVCDGISDDSGELKPCREFCVNAMRGCLAPLFAGDGSTSDGGGGLSKSWENFVRSVERLANSIRGEYSIDEVVGRVGRRLENEVGVLVQTVNNLNHTMVGLLTHYSPMLLIRLQ